MTAGQREQLLRALWPQGAKSKLGVWAILDCARDPQIYRALLESRLEFRCLYSGKLPRELELVAPQLVELFPDNRLTTQWLDQGWGQSWGVLLKVADPSNLRHHLRKLLTVRDEHGRKLLLRYYDPRVLRPFLRSCDPAQLELVFGKTTAYVAEDEDGVDLTEFGLRAGHLIERSLRTSP